MAYFPPTGSVVAFQGNPSVLQVLATVTNPAALSSVSGTVGASVIGTVPVTQSGTVITSVSGQVTVVSSIAGGIFPVSGSVAAVITNTNVNVSGSVVAFQGTTPWAVTNVGSIISLNVGSVIAIVQAASIAGTYAEDSAHTTADRGIFVLGVRNDAVASFVGADLEYGPHATDSAGRTIVKPFAADDSSTFRFSTSVVSGSVTLIKASAIGQRQYVTDFWFVNSGSVATLVTFRDGSTSVVGYAVAPAGTGANSPGINVPLRTAPSQDLTFFQAPSASILYVTVSGYQAP